MNIKNILKKATDILKENNIEDYNLKIKLLLSNILNKPKEYIMIHEDEEIETSLEKEFFSKLDRIKNNEPVQYVINSQEFMGLNFFVNNNVLIPQPDTEILVQEIIDVSKKITNKKMNILDLCTGSGAIIISLAKKIENCNFFASDISKKALDVAKENAKKHNVDISFIESNIFENFSNDQKFDIIASNPPYIKRETIKTLPKEVQNEPLIALDGGMDGLDFYRKIIKESKNYLNSDGLLILEIGYDQKQEVENLFKQNGYVEVYSKKDFAQNDRIVIGKYNNKRNKKCLFHQKLKRN